MGRLYTFLDTNSLKLTHIEVGLLTAADGVQVTGAGEVGPVTPQHIPVYYTKIFIKATHSEVHASNQ